MLLGRRTLLALLAGAALSTPPHLLLARDGNGEGGDNSGPGGGDDGGDDDGGRSQKRDDIEWSQDRVLEERELGRVIPLQTALRIVNRKVRGRVIDIDLMMRGGKPQYRVKVRRTDGIIQTVRLDARTGKVIGFLGF